MYRMIDLQVVITCISYLQVVITCISYLQVAIKCICNEERRHAQVGTVM